MIFEKGLTVLMSCLNNMIGLNIQRKLLYMDNFGASCQHIAVFNNPIKVAIHLLKESPFAVFFVGRFLPRYLHELGGSPSVCGVCVSQN